MLIDSHTHLYLDDYGEDGADTVKRAIEAGVGHMMFPNVDCSSIEPMNALHEKFPEIIDMAIGLHPTEVKDNYNECLKYIFKEARSGKYKALGEIGIDLYWDKTFKEQQIDALRRQCNLALELSLPVIFHCREGLDEILSVFKEMKTVPRGVFHSFSGTIDDVARIQQAGDFYFGINGIVTFKNSGLKSVLPAIPIDRLLLETDAPYLAPVPLRGRRNESAYMVHTAAFIAHTLGLSMDELGRITTENYYTLFG